MVAPKLRFKEFDEDWKLSTLSDISEIITGSTPSTSKSEYYDGNFLFVSPADIQENRYVEATKTTLTKEGFRKCRQIPNNSILFVCIGSTIGKIAQNKEICATNQQINAVVPNENHISDFLYLALDRIAPSIKLTAGIQAIPLINKTQFGKTTLSTPIFEEQTKIATFLSAVDEKIAQLSQKLHLLGQYKQGMMQQLFSQKIRFKADDGSDFGEWEEKELKDVADVKGGKRIPKGFSLVSENTGHPYITVSDMNRSYGIDDTNIRYVPLEVVDVIKRYTITDNDIFISVAGTLGIIGKIPPEFNGANLTENADKLTNLKCHQNFLIYLLDSGYLSELIESTATTSAQPKLALYAIEQLEVNLPCLEEQTKIADFLSTIDQKMDVVSEQLKQAKTWKKGLLQQMFV